MLACLRSPKTQWTAFRRYYACIIQYQPAPTGSPPLQYTVFKYRGAQKVVYRVCIVPSGNYPNGPLTTFTDALIGEHFTITPHLNVLRCYSGIFPGYGESTLQVVLDQPSWHKFLPLYQLFLDYTIDWLGLFDLGLYTIAR